MNINAILSKENISKEEEAIVVNALVKRLQIEFQKNDRSGIYGYTQRTMGYNSNKIEGSTLTPAQTASLFDTGSIRSSGEMMFRAKDVEEMTGHFVMFNKILSTLSEPLSESMIKEFHSALKAGVFEDIANGYPIGEYKNRANMVSDIRTSAPSAVHEDMANLLRCYEPDRKHTLEEIAALHAGYEQIHPFQDGNGRTGRALVFRECLRSEIIPVIIKDERKADYYHALHDAQIDRNDTNLMKLFAQDQAEYMLALKEFLPVYDPRPVDGK
ncbi:MAG: Fic family protein [Lachnospiraceae bacterium]|nr:Fic family protein [Lachnospiraceae bacterium]